ncbi:gluconate transporter, high-affinity GNT I system [Escherichia coli]|nr:gluconate transporter, high-affinity GNT I system [Escherichia coli]
MRWVPGSVIFSHVNDPGFWLFKEYFNLTIGETIKSWSMLETIISVCGLVGCLLLEYGDLITLTAGCIASGINRTLLLLRCSSAPSVQILQQLVHAIIGKHRLKRCGKLASPVFILVTGARNIHRFGHIPASLPAVVLTEHCYCRQCSAANHGSASASIDINDALCPARFGRQPYLCSASSSPCFASSRS